MVSLAVILLMSLIQSCEFEDRKASLCICALAPLVYFQWSVPFSCHVSVLVVFPSLSVVLTFLSLNPVVDKVSYSDEPRRNETNTNSLKKHDPNGFFTVCGLQFLACAGGIISFLLPEDGLGCCPNTLYYVTSISLSMLMIIIALICGSFKYFILPNLLVFFIPSTVVLGHNPYSNIIFAVITIACLVFAFNNSGVTRCMFLLNAPLLFIIFFSGVDRNDPTSLILAGFPLFMFGSCNHILENDSLSSIKYVLVLSQVCRIVGYMDTDKWYVLVFFHYPLFAYCSLFFNLFNELETSFEVTATFLCSLAAPIVSLTAGIMIGNAHLAMSFIIDLLFCFSFFSTDELKDSLGKFTLLSLFGSGLNIAFLWGGIIHEEHTALDLMFWFASLVVSVLLLFYTGLMGNRFLCL
ncbi:hypothetical protein GEMRC1_014004 [Eukaryota sp. GEM-RC1]